MIDLEPSLLDGLTESMKPGPGKTLLETFRPAFEGYNESSKKAMELLDLQKGTEDIDLELLASQVGVEIVYYVLPTTIGGYPYVVEGKKYIVVNSVFSRRVQEYTIAHEIAHHVLNHTDPHSKSLNRCELEAHNLAINLISWGKMGAPEELTAYFNENPEMKAAYALMQVGLWVGGIAAVGYGLYKFIGWLSDSKSPAIENKSAALPQLEQLPCPTSQPSAASTQESQAATN